MGLLPAFISLCTIPLKVLRKPTPSLLETHDVGATGGSILNDGAYSLMQSGDLNKSAGAKGLSHVFNLL